MTTYKIKADTGILGTAFMKPPYDYGQLIKRLAVASVVIVVACLWLKWSADRDEQIMKIQYCWNSDGSHYVCPARSEGTNTPLNALSVGMF